VGLHGSVQREGKRMSDLMERMEQLRAERIVRVAELNKNTIGMRLIAVEAEGAGHSAYRIAKLLGVTTRTVYLWLSHRLAMLPNSGK
jgi:hypothetical protein